MKLSQKLVEERLANWPIARLATADAEGQTHQIPIVFVWQAGKIWSPVDGKPKRGTQLTRVKNALLNTAGSVLLDEYTDDWSQLWWLRIDVTIKAIYQEEANDPLKTDANNAVTALQNKYPQYQQTAVLTEPPTLLLMTPIHYSSWRAS